MIIKAIEDLTNPAYLGYDFLLVRSSIGVIMNFSLSKLIPITTGAYPFWM